ncbi:hypothetical protein GLOTRDRAFT_40964, partial [Gloeophyllum trabeum ATCC 11539]
VYAMAIDEQKALDEFLEENLKTSRIRPSKSPWGAPFFFVKKKDGKLRPVSRRVEFPSLTPSPALVPSTSLCTAVVFHFIRRAACKVGFGRMIKINSQELQRSSSIQAQQTGQVLACHPSRPTT